MTDLEKWKAFLTEFNIEFTFEERHNANGAVNILLEQGNRKVCGYSGFLAAIEFEIDGKFIQIGVWEGGD